MSGKAIILFDGECNLCNGFVQFVLKRDPKGYFKFSSQQCEKAAPILAEFNVEDRLRTVVLIENGKVYKRSTAGLRIMKKLKGLWPLMYVFIIVPARIRDVVYEFISRNRYKWFGHKEACMVPDPNWRERFIL
ncbi:DCC1-like thiol-disulfide oxidoreductase family protein [Cytophagaceae bacterium ABcell3]|nr:DCC1-like thiol-disulfide oxidoreductase family protein [Cytophagaceae bacterium ABcell3]